MARARATRSGGVRGGRAASATPTAAAASSDSGARAIRPYSASRARLESPCARASRARSKERPAWARSEERRVGKECRTGRSPGAERKKRKKDGRDAECRDRLAAAQQHCAVSDARVIAE